MSVSLQMQRAGVDDAVDEFDETRRFRFRLTLQLHGLFGVGRFVFFMLNPSKATKDELDPTVHRCVDYTSIWGGRTTEVVNAFGWCATDPDEMLKMAAAYRADPNALDPVGNPRNDIVIREVVSGLDHHAGDRLVVAWGGFDVPERLAQVRSLLDELDVPLYCIGTNDDGSPCHPLYRPKDYPLEPWSWPTPKPRARRKKSS